MLELTKKIHYHEDDYRNIEIVPNENLEEIINEFKKIQNFSEIKKSNNWNKYTDIYVKEEYKNKTATKKIRLDTIRKIITENMTEFSEVTTGIKPQIYKCEKTIAFWLTKNIIIFVEYRKKTIVENIWLHINVTNEIDKENLIKTLSNLSKKYDLLIVDRNAFFIANLSNEKAINKYLEEKLKINKIAKNKVWTKKWYEFWKI